MSTSSKSRSSQQTNNSSTSLGVQGDNQGFMTVGDGNSYNITTTDGGLVDGLVSIWGDMAGNQSEMINAVGTMASDNASMTQAVTGSAFDYASDVNRDSLDFAESNTKSAFDFGRDSLNSIVDTMSGALGFGRDALAYNTSLANNSIDAQSNLARDSIAAQNSLAESTVRENSDLARSVTEMAETMHGNNTAFANNALLTTVDAVSGANQRMGDLAYYSAENSSNLARDFASATADLGSMAMDNVTNAYKEAGDQTLLAHKQALQFADHATRSDGQQLAISTNETMKYIVIGLGGIAILAMFMGRKK